MLGMLTGNHYVLGEYRAYGQQQALKLGGIGGNSIYLAAFILTPMRINLRQYVNMAMPQKQAAANPAKRQHDIDKQIIWSVTTLPDNNRPTHNDWQCRY